MNRYGLKLAALVGMLLATASPAWAMVCGGGYSQTESNHNIFEHACYEFFFNNSGVILSSGNPVVIDVDGTGVNSVTESVEGPAGTQRNEVDVNASDGDVTNLGTYIEITQTADSGYVIGVIDADTCANQSYCRTQVRGPRLVLCADLTDAVGAGTLVGTTTLAGQCGDSAASAEGALGIALEAGDGTDLDPIMVWIDPGSSP